MKTDTEIKKGPKPGYKLTKLGWIPKDWEIFCLSQIGVFSKGKGISKAEIIESGHPCITYGEIYTKHHFYIKNFDSFINDELAKVSNEINGGEILFAGSGETLDEIGKCVAYLERERAYAGGDIIIFKPHSADSLFLSYLLNSNYILRYRRKLGQGHSVVHIYSSGLKSLEIPTPPLPEQQKIAQILSTWDKAIEKTEQLIRAKTQLKKGLMQQLLTGEKRFICFNKPWEEYYLSDLVRKTKGSIVSTNTEKKGVSLIDASSFNGEPDFFTEDTNAIKCSQNDILILWDGSKAGRVMTNKEGVIGSTFSILTPNHKINNEFLAIRMLYDQARIMAVREGSGIPHVPKDFLSWYKLNVPSGEEQEKIATVFSIIDKEISNLNQLLIKTKNQKKGLMQKLLTGEVRVNTNNNLFYGRKGI